MNNDEAYATVFALQEAGVRVVGVVDVRADSRAADRAVAAGIPVFRQCVIESVQGRRGVTAVGFNNLRGGPHRALVVDSLLVSGGHSPYTTLATQLGATLQWQDAIGAFTPTLSGEHGAIAGAAGGTFGLAAAAADGARVAAEIATALGFPLRTSDMPPWSPDPPQSPLAALWEVSGKRKSFVDLQNDVTASDVRLARREGYEHVEHMKRYTTHSMATDQGRIGGLVGCAILAAARGVPIADVGQPKPRPYAQPVPFAALAGGEVRAHYKPKRRLPLHAWHEAAGATFVSTGLWLRPLVYSRSTGWDAVLAEAQHVRRAAGITDVSTLGKLAVQGPDAAAFLDFVYANTFSTLAVRRARYGIMLREDGMMLDDGTTSRLGPEEFLVTTTTANSAAVLEHLEFQLQTQCRHLDVIVSDVTDEWAQFAVAGPQARAVVAAAVSGVDASNAAFPFMAAAPMELAGIAGRLFRISFSGELAYEVAVPARYAELAWTALLRAGEPHGLRPYGLDALNTLRIEKGHVTGAELNGNTSAADLGFGRMLKKSGDFVGRLLAQRPGMVAPERLQLVGIRALEPGRRLRNGMQLVDPGHRRQASATSPRPRLRPTAAAGWGSRCSAPVRPASAGSLRRPPRSTVSIWPWPWSARTCSIRRTRVSAPNPQPPTAGIALQPWRPEVIEVAALRNGAASVERFGLACGQPLPAFGRVSTAGACLALCVRPARWLLIAAPGDDSRGARAARWRHGCAAAAAVTELSSALTGFRLGGGAVREMLARGCRLDLDPQVFPPGHAAATVMVQVPVVLAALPHGMLLLTASSTAQHFAEWLDSTARPFGRADHQQLDEYFHDATAAR